MTKPAKTSIREQFEAMKQSAEDTLLASQLVKLNKFLMQRAEELPEALSAFAERQSTRQKNEAPTHFEDGTNRFYGKTDIKAAFVPDSRIKELPGYQKIMSLCRQPEHDVAFLMVIERQQGESKSSIPTHAIHMTLDLLKPADESGIYFRQETELPKDRALLSFRHKFKLGS